MTEILSELSSIVGPNGLLIGEVLQARAGSWLGAGGNQAAALVRPVSTAEVSDIMRLCHARGQRAVIQGGMTGLVEGATADPEELAISLERMNRIEAIDEPGRTMTVQAGVTLQTVQETARDLDLLFAADWGARGSATIGGGIATNGGGTNVLRYGMMREQVPGLEVVLSDGTVLSSMNRMLKNNTGYDLKQLFIGSEGTLGIITRAVLRLRPLPRSEDTALLALADLDRVVRLLALLDSRLGGTLTALEVMWRSHYELVVRTGDQRGALPEVYPFYVLVEARGSDASTDRERFECVLAEAQEADLLLDSMMCNSKADRQRLWAIRDDIPALSRALNPMVVYDVSLPIGDMDAYVAEITRTIRAKLPNALGVIFGHLGDGDLHLCWRVGSDSPKDRHTLSSIIYDALIPYGGSISAEHGIGREKLGFLERSRTSVEVLWMQKLKALFDPSGLLNRGRVVEAP